MSRAHDLPVAKDIVFVDSTSSCDPENHCITFLLTPCAAGAAPLGVLITKGQSEESYKAGFLLIKNNVQNAFGGKGFPTIFLTDNSDAEINALKAVWPNSKSFLCIFHVLQAVWRWLWDGKNNINKEDRQPMMQSFRKMLYAETVEEAYTAFEVTLEIGSMYSKWCRYVTVEHWTYKERWCLAWRDHTNRGHHTNNFSEVSVRIFKENVLCRVKAYNVVSIVDFCCIKLEDYYRRKFQEFSNDRNPTARKYFEKIIKLCDYASKDKIYVENEEYYVPSEENKQLMYCVEPTIGICSCKVGIHGKFCKHQGIVYKYFNKIGVNFPPVTIEDKYLIAKLALGEKVPNKTFYEGLLPAEVVHTQSPISHDIHQDSNKKTSTESMQIVKEHNPNLEKQDCLSILDDITQKLSNNIIKYGESTYDNLLKFKKRLDKIHTEGQFNTFLATAGTSSLSLRHRDGASIKVQPTTIARRRPGITRGSKRLIAGKIKIHDTNITITILTIAFFTLGRPATSDNNRPKKKPRNLLHNIKNCVTNAKSH